MSGKVSTFPRELEADLQRDVYALLDALAPRGLVWRRTNSGMAKRGPYWIRLARPGTPDITGHMPDGRALYIELETDQDQITKRSVKRRETKRMQAEFIAKAAAAGCVAFVARTVNEVASRLAREMGG